MLRLHDTASGRARTLELRDEGKVGLYVCGPTVYGAPHVGHGRTTLAFDVLRRYLTYRGLEVHHVSNITDIDDKIIERARVEGRPWQSIAEEYEAQWWETMEGLGVLRPMETPHATGYLDGMIELIGSLIDVGAAYTTSDGAYLETSAVADYGLLAHQRLDSLQPGARVEVIEEKHSPNDFALWKRVKPGEPSWPSPFGEGRPGWHTECVVMSLALLGEGFDLHGGGQDLIFPHHENERAQAVALGRRFASLWVHSGLVTVSGEKMSKSLGNFTTLEELSARSDPRAYRLLVLRSHYRSPLEVTDETLTDAREALARLDSFARRIAEVPSVEPIDEVDAVESQFIAAMDDDLGTPVAVAGLFDALRRANSLLDAGDAAGAASLGRTALRLFAALGVNAAGAVEADEAVEALFERYLAARAVRDFATSDELRSSIAEAGFLVEDTADGSRLRPR